MGQPISVLAKPSADGRFLRLETNRCLGGMGHLRYTSVDDILDDRPTDELARRLFARPGVEAIHIFNNMITVELAGGSTGEGLSDVVEGLYTYWQPGMEPPSFDEDAPAEDG